MAVILGLLNVNLVRAQATPPPVQLLAMSADANPSFEVATIKPSKPDDQRAGFVVSGNQFHIINKPLILIISYAFDVQATQELAFPNGLLPISSTSTANPTVRARRTANSGRS